MTLEADERHESKANIRKKEAGAYKQLLSAVDSHLA